MAAGEGEVSYYTDEEMMLIDDDCIKKAKEEEENGVQKPVLHPLLDSAVSTILMKLKLNVV